MKKPRTNERTKSGPGACASPAQPPPCPAWSAVADEQCAVLVVEAPHGAGREVDVLGCLGVRHGSMKAQKRHVAVERRRRKSPHPGGGDGFETAVDHDAGRRRGAGEVRSAR